MGFQINTNLPSLIAQDNLRLTSDFQQKTITRVTSGLRITQSGDDAAGLAIANGFRSDIAVLTQGVRNANDGLSTLQIIDGGINNISKLLDRARTLATQSASGTFSGSRAVLSSEFQSVLTEINRQAQAIGLDPGGDFAKNLQVFIGGGRANGGTDAINNGSVSVNLANSTVDTQSLGLKGVQVKGVTGTDIGGGSVSTKVSDILANATNTGSVTSGGYTDFMFYGPGFGGSNGVKVSVNTAGVTDVDTLAAAANSAIANAGNGTTQAATAFKNANIVASVNTDANGAKQLTFTSASAAFQVEAGDRLANAFLGNFERNAVAVSTNAAATVNTNTGGTSARLTLTIDGGTVFNADVNTSAAMSKGQLANELNALTAFNTKAVAYVDGNNLVIKSKGNSASSAIAVTTTDLSTNLGLTSAVAAAAPTGADVSTRVQANAATAAGATTFDAAGAGTVRFRLTGASLAAPVDLSVDVAASTTVTQAIAALQTAVSNSTQLAGAGISLTSSTAGNNLVFTSKGGEKFQVDVTGDTRNLLGFGSFITGANNAVDYNTLTASADYGTTGVGTATFEISLAGQASSGNPIAVDMAQGDASFAVATGTDVGATVNTSANVNFAVRINGTVYSGALTSNANATKATLATDINTIITASGAVATLTAGNRIVITTNTKGAGASIEFLTPNANSAMASLGFTTAENARGTSRSGASVAAAVNAAIATDPELAAAGLKADYNVTTTNRVTFTSTNGTNFRVNARSTATGVSVLGAKAENFNTTGANVLSLTVNSTLVSVTLTAGAGQTAAGLAGEIQTRFNAVLGAGVATAAADNGFIKLSTTATGAASNIVIGAGSANNILGFTAATYTGTDANVGYGVTGVSFTGNTISSAPTTSARFDAGGSTQTAALAFNAMGYGDDDQSITITANDTIGAAQAKTIILQNDASARTGRNIDEAVNAINTALQQSNNATLQKIVAVKDNSTGTEQIRFLSTLGSFKVAVGSVPNSGDGVGSAGTTVEATQSSGGNNIDISSQATAQQAVTALASAVAKLGDAQAVVGRGQNQFNYAVNLAQSQLTNIAAAESRIRDADLAAEAANLTKAQIVLQAGVAALAQANSAPQAVLALLRG